MLFGNSASASLSRRFAIAAAILTATAMILISLTSIWLVKRQHASANELLQKREIAFQVKTVANNLQALWLRLSEVANSPILANALVDSAGKDTYLTPFLHGMLQVNGIPVGILFTDFQGNGIAGNGAGTFDDEQLAWLQQQIRNAQETSEIYAGPDGVHLLGVKLLRYSRTSTPEGALMYKIRLADLAPAPSAKVVGIARNAKQVPEASLSAGATSHPIALPPQFGHLSLRLAEDRQQLPEMMNAPTPQYAVILGIAAVLAALVFILGSRLAHSLTVDLRRLELFSSNLGDQGISMQRAALVGSAEVVSLARSMNWMLDQLYWQHTELHHESQKFEQAEMAVRQTEARLQQGLIAARMAVWDWNIADGSASFSANLQSVFGESWTELRRFWELVDPSDVPLLRKAVDGAIRQCSEFHAVVSVRRPDNDIDVWVEIRGRVGVNPEGRPDIIHAVAIDVTERRRAEDALRTADRRKDEFLAMLAHELRNPLSPISSAAELLKLMGVAEPRVRQTGEVIERQVRHMTRLVDDLLDVSRVTRGLVTISRQTVDLREVAKEAVEQTGALVATRLHRLETDLPPQPVWINGDHTRLVQVVGNLVANSAKYTPDGGYIQLILRVEANRAVLRVRDNGSGISPSLLPEVFELFTQGERTLARSQGGLGLGLALVRKLIELHGGEVAAYSEGVDQGSEFTLWLPLDLEAERPVPYVADGTPVTCETGVPLSILVVDDNVDAADGMSMLLQTEGHRVSVEYTAQRALRRAQAEIFDVVILDIGLPDMDGYQLARHLRTLPHAAHSTLIAVTGYGQEEDRAKSSAAGFAEHLVKPVGGAQLSALLRTYNPAPRDR